MPRDHGSIHIDGEWASPSSSATIPVVEAATEQALGNIADADAKDVDRAVQAARRALSDWAATLAEHRADLLEQLAGMLDKRSAEITEIVSRQDGMPQAFAAWANVGSMAATLRYYAGLARTALAEDVRCRTPATSTFSASRLASLPSSCRGTIPRPGRVQARPALAAGCTVVMKPAPETSLDSYLLMDASKEAGFPPGVVNLVTGGPETDEALVRHLLVDKVSFTGSTAVGRRIGAICGEALKPVTLELGGKSAAVVLPDADLGSVMEGLAFLSFACTGQSCFLNSRVLAPRARYGEVVDGLAQLAQSFQLGDPLDENTTMGPLVSDRQRQRVESYIAQGREECARLVTGGGRPGNLDRGWFVEPTVFADVDTR